MLGFLTSLFYSVCSLIRLCFWYGEAIFRYFIPRPMKSLDGETILVTGGASGIGKEICKYITRSTTNVKLVIWDLNRKGLDQLAQELERNARGIRVFVYQVDISRKENIQKAATLVKIDVGPVTVLINNAGIAPIHSFLEYGDPEIESTLQVNLMAPLWTLRAFLGDMMSANHGRIMNISSLLALAPGRCVLPYVASKSGLVGAGEALKAELEYFGYDGIRVTTVFPTGTRTPLFGAIQLVPEAAGMPASMAEIMEPDVVARVAVDGMRREMEFIYFPKQLAGAVAGLDCLLPMKQRKLHRVMWGKMCRFSDPEYNRRRRVGGDSGRKSNRSRN